MARKCAEVPFELNDSLILSVLFIGEFSRCELGNKECIYLFIYLFQTGGLKNCVIVP